MNKREAWLCAVDMVEPIIEEHALEQYSVDSLAGTTMTHTELDQHIDQIIRVADWLLEDQEN